MGKKPAYSLYEVCDCNHEWLQHGKICSASVPVGKKGYRGYVSVETPSAPCGCKKFVLSVMNTSNPKPTEDF